MRLNFKFFYNFPLFYPINADGPPFFERLERDVLAPLPAAGASAASGGAEGGDAKGFFHPATLQFVGSVRSAATTVATRWRCSRPKYGPNLVGMPLRPPLLFMRSRLAAVDEGARRAHRHLFDRLLDDAAAARPSRRRRRPPYGRAVPDEIGRRARHHRRRR